MLSVKFMRIPINLKTRGSTIISRNPLNSLNLGIRLNRSWLLTQWCQCSRSFPTSTVNRLPLLYCFFVQSYKLLSSISRVFLDIHEIVDGVKFHCSVSVCVRVCLSVNEQNSRQTDAPIWTRYSLNCCLLYWLGLC